MRQPVEIEKVKKVSALSDEERKIFEESMRHNDDLLKSLAQL